tara:strand:- start:2402 stop:2662 length:261 start_codon:yes stop_codon:yes gene_type:complete
MENRHKNLWWKLKVLTEGKHYIKGVTQSFRFAIPVNCQVDLIDLSPLRVAVDLGTCKLRCSGHFLEKTPGHGDNLLIGEAASRSLG